MRKTTTAVLIALTMMLVMTGAQAYATSDEYRIELLPTFNIGETSGAGGTMTGNAEPVKLLQPASGTVGYAPFPVDKCKPLTLQRRGQGPR